MPSFRGLSDDQLLAQCRFEAFRGPGPGGQKRNKTSSAVRLTHAPSGISVIAGESRSQHRNRQVAINRLRHQIALRLREPLDPSQFPDPARLQVSRRSADYPAAVGIVLDALSSAGWSVSAAADILGVTTAPLVSFLRGDAMLWTEVNRQRQKIGLRTLN
ncbi:MAG: peptide chain release factor-like protein [Tepidisphaeraceae bacterium]